MIAVRVDTEGQEGWWYEGAGIYRSVWLVERNPIHIVQTTVMRGTGVKVQPQSQGVIHNLADAFPSGTVGLRFARHRKRNGFLVSERYLVSPGLEQSSVELQITHVVLRVLDAATVAGGSRFRQVDSVDQNAIHLHLKALASDGTQFVDISRKWGWKPSIRSLCVADSPILIFFDNRA